MVVHHVECDTIVGTARLERLPVCRDFEPLAAGDSPRQPVVAQEDELVAKGDIRGHIDPAQAAIDEVGMAERCVEAILDSPLPTTEKPGAGGDAVALNLAHYLGPLADLTDRGPWLAQFRDELLNSSKRYWSGLFHCHYVVGLPATNNDHESLYGQTKRQLRRQLGISELRNPC